MVLKKIKLSPTLEHENINNFKALQGAFKKAGVDKVSEENSVLWIIEYKMI